MSPEKGLLHRLEEGVVVGDGGFTWQLEKRGYVLAGTWTPEVVVERPGAVLSLHREFLDAGSDVMQAFTFYASESKLSYGGNKALEKNTCFNINKAACQLARQVANEGDALVCASLSQTPSYTAGAGKKAVQAEFQKQVDVFVECKVDFIVAEFFDAIEEMEWVIEVATKTGLPVVASMCIGPEGDRANVSCGQCAVRMAKAGAHVVGVNCLFDPIITLQSIRLMKKALDAAELKVHLITQPNAYHVPEAGKGGYTNLPEFPFALEPRLCTRFDMQKYAREAYNLGVRYIGGCCGTEAYHIRAIVQELEAERGTRPTPFSCTKHIPWGGALKMSVVPCVRARASREYWENLEPSTGRPKSASMSTPQV